MSLLLQLFEGMEKIPKWQLNSLELFTILNSTPNVIDFSYKNGNKGWDIIIPQV